MSWIGQMYRTGMPNGSITSVMTGVFEESGKNGKFVTDTIENITQKMTKTMDAVKGISQDFIIAERTLERLNW